MTGPLEARAGLARMRVATCLRLLRRHRPSAPLREVLRALVLRSGVLSRSIRLLERDAAEEMILCRPPGYSRPLWFPTTDLASAETTLYLHTLDYYHLAYIGDLLTPGAVVFDCGGYAGEFALWALERGADHVLIFEPAPLNAECVRRNLAPYLQRGRVTLDTRAVWAECGQVHLRLVPETNGCALSEVGPTPLLPPRAEDTLVPVEAVSIDAAMSEAGVRRLDLLKMDVEGAERHALRGAASALAAHGPALVICTYHLPEDPQLVPSLVGQANPRYRAARARSRHPVYVVPKQGGLSAGPGGAKTA